MAPVAFENLRSSAAGLRLGMEPTVGGGCHNRLVHGPKPLALLRDSAPSVFAEAVCVVGRTDIELMALGSYSNLRVDRVEVRILRKGVAGLTGCAESRVWMPGLCQEISGAVTCTSTSGKERGCPVS